MFLFTDRKEERESVSQKNFMKLHIHTGPGHHEKILVKQLMNHGMSFSYTYYHPKYLFGTVENGQLTRQHGSGVYDITNKLVWGVRNRVESLRKAKKHLDITYPLYDYLTSRQLSDCKVLFAWPQVSLQSIKQVKKQGGVAILDYPIPHIKTWMDILAEESKTFNIPVAQSSYSKETYHRMLEEIRLADFINIPSIFVKKSFLDNGVPEEKLIVNNYGIDTKLFRPSEISQKGDTFKVIIVGTVEIRKGLQYLLKAFDLISNPNIELRIIGKIHPHFEGIKQEYSNRKNVKWLGLLPKEVTAEEMRTADVMVMPSLLEGLSLTIIETMASGTPVISSEHAGGLDIIDEGVNGFIVPIRSPEALKDRINWCYENRSKLAEMGASARKKALSGFSQDDYGDRIVSSLKSFL